MRKEAAPPADQARPIAVQSCRASRLSSSVLSKKKAFREKENVVNASSHRPQKRGRFSTLSARPPTPPRRRRRVSTEGPEGSCSLASASAPALPSIQRKTCHDREKAAIDEPKSDSVVKSVSGIKMDVTGKEMSARTSSLTAQVGDARISNGGFIASRLVSIETSSVAGYRSARNSKMVKDENGKVPSGRSSSAKSFRSATLQPTLSDSGRIGPVGTGTGVSDLNTRANNRMSSATTVEKVATADIHASPQLRPLLLCTTSRDTKQNNQIKAETKVSRENLGKAGCGNKMETITSDTLLVKSSSPRNFDRTINLTKDQASLMAFPPGCRVLVFPNDDGNLSFDSFNIHSATVASASISLGNGTWINNYNLEANQSVDSHNPVRLGQKLEAIPETRLIYAPGCRVQVSPRHFRPANECKDSEREPWKDGVVVGWSHAPPQPLYSVELLQRENRSIIEHCINYQHIRFLPTCVKSTGNGSCVASFVVPGDKAKDNTFHSYTEPTVADSIKSLPLSSSLNSGDGTHEVSKGLSSRRPTPNDGGQHLHQEIERGFGAVSAGVSPLSRGESGEGPPSRIKVLVVNNENICQEVKRQKLDFARQNGTDSASIDCNSKARRSCQISTGTCDGRKGIVTAEVLVTQNADPVYVMHFIIGPGGRVNKDIEMRTGCKIHVRGNAMFLSTHEKFNKGPFRVTIAGRNDACVARARVEVEHIIRSARTKIVFAPVDVKPDVIRDSLLWHARGRAFLDEMKSLAKGVVQLRGVGSRSSVAKCNSGPLRVVLFGADEVALDQASNAIFDHFARVRARWTKW